MPVQTMETLKARMKHPVAVHPAALKALLDLGEAVNKSGLPQKTTHMVHLRASQINGCSVCVDMHAREMKQAGDSDEKIFAVAAWRDNPIFDDAERAALGLTEALTRIEDRAEPVRDEIWNEAARHFDENALAGLVLAIAGINTWNRLNVAVRQVVGAWKG